MTSVPTGLGSPHGFGADHHFARGPEIATLVHGTSFLVCTSDGEIDGSSAQGYFVGDTRMISSLSLRIDGHRVRVLDHHADDSSFRSVGFVGDPVEPMLLVRRTFTLGELLVLRLEVDNLASAPRSTKVELLADSDFADVFEVKRGDTARRGFVGSGRTDGRFTISYRSETFERTLTVESDVDDVTILRDGMLFELDIGPHSTRTIECAFVTSAEGGRRLTVLPDSPDARASWCSIPELRIAPIAFATTWDRSVRDIESLLLLDPEDRSRTIVAAGSPWFMALFGRDSLLTGWSCLPICPEMAIGVLEALAVRQGRAIVESTDERPGRILHEIRRGEIVHRRGGWGEVYYGSVDATPLFVRTLARAWQWGAPRERIEGLLPAAERAVDSILDSIEDDPNGFLTYPGPGSGGSGLVNQGWKDSDDAVVHRDGSIPEGPIAMVEVQGYCHAALLALAELRVALGAGDPDGLRTAASELAARIDERFWMPDEDCYAMALDGHGEQVATVASNAGHLLWTGSVPSARVDALAHRLAAPDMFTGFGIRTLSSRHIAYNPLSYHRGSVWPHDTALIVDGMFRNGRADLGSAIAFGLLDAAIDDEGRFPELLGGFDRGREPSVIPYPTSCAPQAWSAAVPFLLLQSLLGIDPCVPEGLVALTPRLPEGAPLRIDGLHLGTGRLSLRAHDDGVEILECPPSIDVRIHR